MPKVNYKYFLVLPENEYEPSKDKFAYETDEIEWL